MEEWLLSAEYILAGRQQGRDPLRARYPHVRDLHPQHARPVGDSIVKELSHLPIFVDPSHGMGRRDKVAPMAARGGCRRRRWPDHRGHNDPDHALSDGAQSMFPAQFDRLMAELRIIAPAIGRSICLEPGRPPRLGEEFGAVGCLYDA
jgi:3-deoxy-7-phosphoheptulonate synthase